MHITSPSINVILCKDTTKQDLVTFLHGAMCSPVPSTWIKAINNNHFTTWPGLTTTLVKKYLQPSIATAKGHLNQEQKNLQSTKNVKNSSNKSDLEDFFPTSNVPNIKTNDAIYYLAAPEELNKAYSNLTGCFPLQSSRGNNYILVAYHPNANAILLEPLRNRTATEIVNAWKKINTKLKSCALKPNTWILNNECSADLKNALTHKQITWQLAPPHQHRTNAAERAIQTLKNHVKACLATVDPDYPLKEWDRLLLQVEITLNLLRSARVNPRLSAYAYLFGEFDYNKTPLVPPGTKLVAHNKPSNRSSWALNGEGWTIGPSMEHYRCIKCFFLKTRSERNVDTVTFFPKQISFPKIDLDAFLRQAATDIIAILSDPPSTTTLQLKAGASTQNALLEISDILQRTEKLPMISQEKKIISPRVQDNIPFPRVHPTQSSPRVQFFKDLLKITNTTKKHLSHQLSGPHQYPLRNITTTSRYHQRNTGSRSYRSQAADYLYAQHVYQKYVQPIFSASHIYDATGKRQTIDALLQGEHGTAGWYPALSNKRGRLAQGNDNGVAFTNTITFIPKTDVPKNIKVMYASFACDYRPLKDKKWRICIVVGGDKTFDTGSPAADIVETKLLFNSVISDAKSGAKFCSMDLKDMFLHTPMTDPEFMKVPYKYFPPRYPQTL